MSLHELVYEPVSVFSVEDPSHAFTCEVIAFSPDGAFLAAAFGNTIRVWSTEDASRHIFDYKAWKDMLVTCMIWNYQGLHCGYSNGGYCTIDLDAVTWAFCVSGFWMGSISISHIAQQSVGHRLLAVACKGAVNLWGRTASGSGHSRSSSSNAGWNELVTLPSPHPIHNILDKLEVTGMSWRVSDPQHLVVCYLNHGVIIWDTLSGTPADNTVGIPIQSFSTSFSPTTSHLAVLNQYNGIEIYDLDTQRWLKTLPEILPETGVERGKRAISYSDTGSTFFAARNDAVCMWQTDGFTEPSYLAYDQFGFPEVESIQAVVTFEQVCTADPCLYIATAVNKTAITLHAGRPRQTGRHSRGAIMLPPHWPTILSFAYSACALLVAMLCGLWIGRKTVPVY